MRLNLFIARSGYASRRKADELVKGGQVKINNRVVTNCGYRVEPDDKVAIGSELLKIKSFVYVIFNKPCGVTTTLKDKFAKHTVVDHLPAQLGKVYPVGRLDKNSQGLLLLTNDGDLCYRISHPKFNVEKEYILEVRGNVEPGDLRKAVRGVMDGGERLRVKRVSIDGKNKEVTTLRVIVCEGRKRQLRRLFMRLGFKVVLVKRVRIGSLHLGSLKQGEFSILSREKIARIFRVKHKGGQ